MKSEFQLKYSTEFYNEFHVINEELFSKIRKELEK